MSESDLYTDLTEQQERVLDFIEDRIQDGLPPTRSEICKRFKWRSLNAADEILHRLEAKGRIKLIPGISRGIKLVEP